MKHRWIPVTLFAAAASVALAAEMVTVNVSDLSIRTKPNNYSKTIGQTPAKGARVEVVEKQGEFLKVSFAGQQGWVRESDLEPVKAGKSELSKFGGLVSGGTGAGGVQEAGATKGLTAGADAYARSIGVDPRKIDALRDRRKKIVDSGKLEQFSAEGKVGAR